MIEAAGRTVGRVYGTFPSTVLDRSLGWVVDEYLYVQRQMYHESMLQMRIVEAGCVRALATMLSGKPLPEPEEAETQAQKRPEWWKAYAEANPQVKI